MAIKKSSECTLKINNAGAFILIAGARICSFKVNNKVQDSSNLASGIWRKLLEKAGTKFISISVSGIFAGSAGEIKIREKAISSEKATYRIDFAEGKQIEGDFIISEYKYFAENNLEQSFEVTLESSEDISLV